MKIFISYRRADSGYVVDRIRDRLILAYEVDSVFRDIESISAGEDYTEVLNSETNGCDVMLVIIGPEWARITDAQGNKRLDDPADWTRIEIETGLKREIPVIPVLVMGAHMPSPKDLPDSLSELTKRNKVDVRKDPDFENDIQGLISGINKATGGTVETITIESFEPETVFIPRDSFLMGGDQEVSLPAYRIGIYPVTIAQYEEFISKNKQKRVSRSMGWEGQRAPKGTGNYPVTGVTWYDALDYCNWLSQTTGRSYTLPNEAQWEKACRGGNNYVFPWGNEFDATRCNHGRPDLAPVDAYLAQSEYGFDFVGNVRQWTCTLWGEDRFTPDSRYPYNKWQVDGRNNLDAGRQVRRVMRGSSMNDSIKLLRCTARSGELPNDPDSSDTRYGFRYGFRVAIEPSKK